MTLTANAAPEIAGVDYTKFPKDPGAYSISGNKYYVATTGSDSNSGTLSQPFKTINKAISISKEGDCIYVRGGTYSLPTYNERLHVSKNNLLITNYQNEIVNIKSTGSRYGFILTGDNLIVDGFNLDGFATAINFGKSTTQKNLILKNIKITNSGEGLAGSYDGTNTILQGALFKNIEIKNPDTSGYVIGLHCGGPPCQDIRITNTNIDLTGSAGGGSGADGIAMETGNNILIEDSIVTGASADGIDLKASKVAVVNTIVKHITRNGIKFWQGGDIINSISTDTGADAAIVFDGPGKYRIINSVVAYHNKNGQNSYTATFGYDGGGSNMEVEILNSIFHKNVGSVWINDQAKLTIKNNIFSGGTQTGRYIDYKGVAYGDTYAQQGWGQKLTELDASLMETKDALFVDAPNNNFQLKENSPAIDTGITTLATTDLSGNVRPQGKAFDVGAYELTATPPPEEKTTTNNMPSLSEIKITPSSPLTTDKLVVKTTYSDEGLGTVILRWMVDGVQVRAKVFRDVKSGTTLTFDLDHRYTDPGDKVYVFATANDGTNHLKKNSETLTIGSSSTTVIIEKSEIQELIKLIEAVLAKLKSFL